MKGKEPKNLEAAIEVRQLKEIRTQNLFLMSIGTLQLFAKTLSGFFDVCIIEVFILKKVLDLAVVF